MLVSSIGYFQGKTANYAVKNQCNKNALSEGFGHDFDKTCCKRKSNVFANVVKSIKNSFSKCSSNKKDCLSLIG